MTTYNNIDNMTDYQVEEMYDYVMGGDATITEKRKSLKKFMAEEGETVDTVNTYVAETKHIEYKELELLGHFDY